MKRKMRTAGKRTIDQMPAGMKFGSGLWVNMMLEGRPYRLCVPATRRGAYHRARRSAA